MARLGLWMVSTAVLTACMAIPHYDAAFSAVDTNRDAVIEWREFKAYYPEAEPKSFLEADHDKNGDVSSQEWQAFISNQTS